MGGGPESRCVGCVQFGWCRTATSTSSVPDDGRMRPKHVELRKLQ